MSESVSEQLNLPEVTEIQKLRFKRICERVSNGEISANKSYEYAQMDGQNEDDKGFKGGFKDWVTLATSNDWFKDKNNVETVVQPEPEKKKTNVILPILIGVGVVVVLYVIVKRMTAKENK